MNSQDNPYLAPQAVVDDVRDLSAEAVIPGGRRVPLRRAFVWIAEGWALFKYSPGMWFFTLTLMIIIMALWRWGTDASMNAFGFDYWFILGIVTSTVGQYLLFTFSGGWMKAAHALSAGGTLIRWPLAEAFHYKKALLGAFAIIFIAVTISGLFWVPIISDLLLTNSLAEFSFQTRLHIYSVISAIFLLSPYLFAPALVVLTPTPSTRAVYWAFVGYWKNIFPILVMWITIALAIAFVLFIFLMINPESVSLALIILSIPTAPTLMCAIYAAYRDIYNPSASQA